MTYFQESTEETDEYIRMYYLSWCGTLIFILVVGGLGAALTF